MINEILNKSSYTKKDLNTMYLGYKEITGRVVCLSCKGEVANMILTLKNYFKMTNFKFKSPLAQYKNKKGDTSTISNSNMNDEKAIEFLRTRPERIELFVEYPENWKELLSNEVPFGVGNDVKKIDVVEPEEIKGDCDEDCDECDECKEKKKKELESFSLPELREKYPFDEFGVKATSKKAFIDKLLSL